MTKQNSTGKLKRVADENTRKQKKYHLKKNYFEEKHTHKIKYCFMRVAKRKSQLKDLDPPVDGRWIFHLLWDALRNPEHVPLLLLLEFGVRPETREMGLLLERKTI